MFWTSRETAPSLGKTAGKDARAEKSTYVSTLGLTGAKEEADRLLHEALEACRYSVAKPIPCAVWPGKWCTGTLDRVASAQIAASTITDRVRQSRP